MRHIVPFLCATILLSAASDDFEALRAWIATKRQVTVKERGGSLSLSGDIRAEYTSTNEHQDGYKNIGGSSLHPTVATDQFRITFNSLLDYRSESTWASVRFKLSNIMGSSTGTTNRLSLDRAFIGFRLIDAERFTFDIEPGRRKLNYTFDSRIEFGAMMDGFLIKYDQSSDRFGDIYFHGGPFIVNEVATQYAYVFELGILNIYNTGIYLKYSFIDWDTKSGTQPTYQFLDQQFILGYRFNFPKINKVSVLYSAFLFNAAATNESGPNGARANLAGYVGFTMGEARAKGDWAIDTNIQYVEPQSIAPFDFNGMGNNFASPNDPPNYIGYLFEFAYLITDNLTISQSFKCSFSLHFPPLPYYSDKQYRLEFIYAW